RLRLCVKTDVRTIRKPLQTLDQLTCKLFGSDRVVSSELDEQVTAAFGNQFEIRRALPPQTVDHRAFEAFKADWLDGKNLRDVVGSGKRVAVTEADERAVLRTWNQPGLCLEHCGTCPFSSDKRPSDVEPVFRKQLVEVIARHAPRNVRIFGTDQIGIAVADPA